MFLAAGWATSISRKIAFPSFVSLERNRGKIAAEGTSKDENTADKVKISFR